MNKQDAERITTEYLKPVYGFALKRCRSLQDAEDLSQDIVLRIFTALLKREDIVDVQKYVCELVRNGKLQPPVEEQKSALSTIILRK